MNATLVQLIVPQIYVLQLHHQTELLIIEAGGTAKHSDWLVVNRNYWSQCK